WYQSHKSVKTRYSCCPIDPVRETPDTACVMAVSQRLTMKKDVVQQRGRRGVILITAAGMMFVLMAFVGLAFDVGFMQWSRRRAQTAADAGALAGAWALQLGGVVTTDGKDGSAVNGF